MSRRVAFVSGASRGIGRASALVLAERGYDIAVCARTLEEGRTADGRPLPGSVETTVREVRERGREALGLYLDLLDLDSIDAATDETLRRWGRIDLLLNNAIYTGSGPMQRVLELELDVVRRMFEANVFAQLHLTQRLLPHMLERGSGILINMVSDAGLSDPPAPAGRGGWGFAYAATKAAFHRMVGVLAVEHADSGLRFHNLEPGFVQTEAMALHDPDGEIAKRFGGAPPTVPAAVVGWLASDAAAAEWSGKTLLAQPFCLKNGLHPDWR